MKQMSFKDKILRNSYNFINIFLLTKLIIMSQECGFAFSFDFFEFSSSCLAFPMLMVLVDSTVGTEPHLALASFRDKDPCNIRSCTRT